MKVSILAITGIISVGSATKVNGILSNERIPTTGRDWVTLDNGYQFQPAEDMNPPMEYVRKLTSKSSSSTGFEDNPFAEIFVDGTETHYDQYAQAWRALGFYIDCDACADGGNNINDCVNQQNKGGCQRYLLWAAVRTDTCRHISGFRLVSAVLTQPSTYILFLSTGSMLILAIKVAV